ncbi:MAG: DUF2059 domain-containing protein [Pseudomonadota bacterium]
MKIIKALAFCALLTPLSALAQTTPTTSADSVDPARLKLARQLIDQISPPEKRDAMIEAIIRPMMANMRDSFEQSPEFAKLFSKQPAMRAEMLKFISDETERSLRLARETMPSLFDAMAIAYARRFTIDQLIDLQRFYDTPTGRAYAEEAPAVMSDPAVMAAQRAMMAKSFEGMQDRAKDFAKRMETLAGASAS